MPQIFDYMRKYREPVPEWLVNYHPGGQLTFDQILSGRFSYYPGFGHDGTMIYVGNKSHAVHSHILLDYLNKLEEDLKQVNSITGYTSIGHHDWRLTDILPHGKYAYNVSHKPMRAPNAFIKDCQPHYFTEILQRDEGLDDSHGAERMAVTVMRVDGIDAYYQLFVREYGRTPWIFLLQDHGFGCNYDRFGCNGLLHAILKKNKCFPDFVISEDKNIWDGYEQIVEAGYICGGMNHYRRGLWRLKSFQFSWLI